MSLHPDSISKYCPAGKSTRGVNTNNTNFHFLFSEELYEIISQGTLASTRCTSHTNYISLSSMGIDNIHFFKCIWRIILYAADKPGRSLNVTF